MLGATYLSFWSMIVSSIAKNDRFWADYRYILRRLRLMQAVLHQRFDDSRRRSYEVDHASSASSRQRHAPFAGQ